MTINKDEIRKEIGRTELNPTQGQVAAGNYRKGHIRINGYAITIENPKGSYRKGVDRNGKEWKNRMRDDYGYFTRTKGKDGDAIDVFVGTSYSSTRIFVIDQRVNGAFDESKVMFCFKDKDSAVEGYLRNYDDEWKGFWKVTEVSPEIFREWLYDGFKQRKPFHQYVKIRKNQIKGNGTVLKITKKKR